MFLLSTLFVFIAFLSEIFSFLVKNCCSLANQNWLKIGNRWGLFSALVCRSMTLQYLQLSIWSNSVARTTSHILNHIDYYSKIFKNIQLLCFKRNNIFSWNNGRVLKIRALGNVPEWLGLAVLFIFTTAGILFASLRWRMRVEKQKSLEWNNISWDTKLAFFLLIFSFFRSSQSFRKLNIFDLSLLRLHWLSVSKKYFLN